MHAGKGPRRPPVGAARPVSLPRNARPLTISPQLPRLMKSQQKLQRLHEAGIHDKVGLVQSSEKREPKLGGAESLLQHNYDFVLLRATGKVTYLAALH